MKRATLLALLIGTMVIFGGCSNLCCDCVPDSRYDNMRDVSSSWCRTSPCLWPPEGKRLDESEVPLTPTWNKFFGCGKTNDYDYTKGPADCLTGREARLRAGASYGGGG